MHLIEILLPLTSNQGRRFPEAFYDEVRQALVDQFGGLTAFVRAPAEGDEKSGGHERRDMIVVFEVLVEEIDRPWWETYRERLEARFEQDRIVIRASNVTLL